MSLPAKYDPIPFRIWYAENKEDLEKEFGTPSANETQCCEECNGDGSLECDLGHDHDCDECDGTGTIHLTEDEALYLYAGHVFEDQVRRDKNAVERYEKEMSHANS